MPNGFGPGISTITGKPVPISAFSPGQIDFANLAYMTPQTAWETRPQGKEGIYTAPPTRAHQLLPFGQQIAGETPWLSKETAVDAATMIPLGKLFGIAKASPEAWQVLQRVAKDQRGFVNVGQLRDAIKQFGEGVAQELEPLIKSMPRSFWEPLQSVEKASPAIMEKVGGKASYEGLFLPDSLRVLAKKGQLPSKTVETLRHEIAAHFIGEQYSTKEDIVKVLKAMKKMGVTAPYSWIEEYWNLAKYGTSKRAKKASELFASAIEKIPSEDLPKVLEAVYDARKTRVLDRYNFLQKFLDDNVKNLNRYPARSLLRETAEKDIAEAKRSLAKLQPWIEDYKAREAAEKIETKHVKKAFKPSIEKPISGVKMRERAEAPAKAKPSDKKLLELERSGYKDALKKEFKSGEEFDSFLDKTKDLSRAEKEKLLLGMSHKVKAKEPWEMTKEEFIAKPPTGYLYKPGREYAGQRNIAEGITNISDPFFSDPDPASRKALLLHETGHDLIRNFNKDFKDVFEPLKKGFGKDSYGQNREIFDNPFGFRENPEEIIADTYTSLFESFPYEKGEKYDALRKRVAEIAVREGKFVPREVIEEYSLSKAKTKEVTFQAGDFVEFKAPDGSIVRGKVRDADPHSGEVWVFHNRPELFDSREAASTTLQASQLKKLK